MAKNTESKYSVMKRGSKVSGTRRVHKIKQFLNIMTMY